MADMESLESSLNGDIIMGFTGRPLAILRLTFGLPWNRKTNGMNNTLLNGRSGCNVKNAICNLVLLNGIVRSFHDNDLRWMPQDLTNDKPTLVQATSHYLNQCWPRWPMPYVVTRSHWVNHDLFKHSGLKKVAAILIWTHFFLKFILLL